MKICECGCGRSFTTSSPHKQKYYSPECRERHQAQMKLNKECKFTFTATENIGPGDPVALDFNSMTARIIRDGNPHIIPYFGLDKGDSFVITLSLRRNT
ncbi:MAG: hypothetical protein PHZ19_08885 [Candidatus Thermoplasmatota archaeon]|nr:hypothetical protein [Candidatus Thermoplasmatota archaeon]